MWLANFWIRGTVALLALGVGFGYGHWQWVRPKLLRKEALERRIRRLDKKIQDSLSTFSNAKQLRVRLEENESQLAFLQTEILGMNPDLLTQSELENLLRGPNALIFKDPERPLGNFIQQKFKVTLPSHYDETLRYLRWIEDYHPSVTLGSLKMVQKDNGVTDPPLLEIELETIWNPSPRPSPQRGEGRVRGKALLNLRTSIPDLQDLGIRDPFVFNLDAGSLKGSDLPFYLKEIIFRGRNCYAVINGEVVGEGDFISGSLFIKEISPRRIVVSEKGSERIFNL